MTRVLFPLSIYAATSPVIAQQSYPEVKPGPGLPSLASLNVTSAQLYQAKPATLPTGRYALATEVNGLCGGVRDDPAPVDDVIACFNYLTQLGHQACVVPPKTGVQFCEAGDASIEGEAYETDKTVSSYW
ncbi:hypothetical protein ACLMJK_005673 [Lecanora helva]